MARSLSHRSMLNISICDPWQRSLFSRQQTPGKEPLLAGKTDLRRFTKSKNYIYGPWAFIGILYNTKVFVVIIYKASFVVLL